MTNTKTAKRSTVRVYQISHKLKLTPEQVLDCARQLGIDITSHMAAISAEDADRVEAVLAPGGQSRSAPDVHDDSRFGLVKDVEGEETEDTAPEEATETVEEPQPEPVAEKEPEPEKKPAPKEAAKKAPEKPAQPQPPSPEKPQPRRLVKKPANITGPIHTKRAEEAEPASASAAGSGGKLTRKSLREIERQRAAERARPRRGPSRPSRPPVGRRRSARTGRSATIIEMPKSVEMTPPITVKDLSSAFGIKANQLLRKLMEMGMMVNINAIIPPDQAQLVAIEFEREVVIKHEKTAEESLMEAVGHSDFGANESSEETEESGDDREARAPVIAFLGHVDHGKTSLIDAIRQANVVDSESGGITQHIGAYKVLTESGHEITILDTPGHKAFTEMRARGANTTDIVVLVVAADDGVMPQTEEAIDHAKAAGVPILVALNKIDKANANVDRVKQQLSAKELIPEDWGGDTIVVPVSALKKQGIEDLLEMISLRAEIEEYSASPDRKAHGTVLEARVSEGRGIIANVLVQDGTLRIGDNFICDVAAGRVKAMYDDHGKPLSEAGPSTPVEIIGLDEVPEAGAQFYVVNQRDVKHAQQVAEERREKQRQSELAERSSVTLSNLFEHIAQTKEVRLLVKADVKGSLEVLRRELEDMATDEIKVRILRAAVGGVSESDVLLAQTSAAIIIGFHVAVDDVARSLAEEKGVDVKIYHVIYDLLDDVKNAMEGLLEPIQREEITGHATIRQVFSASGVGNIAGCYVTDGAIQRSNLVRLFRDGRVIYSGKMSSLKRFKEDVKEVRSGFECGIKIDGYDDIKVEDSIEAYKVVEEKQKL
ncbi:MAG: translation initiation factor IF-2 [Planctomycetota bacterium]